MGCAKGANQHTARAMTKRSLGKSVSFVTGSVAGLVSVSSDEDGDGDAAAISIGVNGIT